LAPLLLCRELQGLGLGVTAFTEALLFGRGVVSESFRIVTPRVRVGCRWDIPTRILSRQAVAEVRRQRPRYVFVCGVTRLARYLLESKIAGQLLIWEFTNATPSNKLVDERARCLLAKCRFVLSPSVAIDAGVRSTYGYRGRILRLPFWVVDHNVRLNARRAKPLTDFIYLGRRDPEKGLSELVAATAIVAKSYPDVSVLIAGPGREEPFHGQAEQAGVGRNVSFKFFETHAGVLDALARSRCLVLPSYHEGYPLVLLEAAELGVPFVATRVGSVEEVFDGTGCGLIVPPRDEIALAQAMLQILREPDEDYLARRSAARAAFQRLSSKQAVRGFVKNVLALSSDGRP